MSASVRQGLLRMWLFVVAAVVGASLTPTQAHADPPGRLFYEIVVIVPGTRSQAWEATLYDAAGKPIQVQLGALDPELAVTLEFIDHKNAAVMRTDDGYAYVIMPLTRDH